MYTNYCKGRKKEYKICKALREDGFDIVQRSAGSRSCIDVLAIRKEDNRILLIQSKPESLSVSAKDKLLRDNDWLNGEFNTEFIVE